MKRILLKVHGPLGIQATSIEVEDDVAKKAIADGHAELAPDQVVYNHESEIKSAEKAEKAKK